jgi:hypothetical protein
MQAAGQPLSSRQKGLLDPERPDWFSADHRDIAEYDQRKGQESRATELINSMSAKMQNDPNYGPEDMLVDAAKANMLDNPNIKTFMQPMIQRRAEELFRNKANKRKMRPEDVPMAASEAGLSQDSPLIAAMQNQISENNLRSMLDTPGPYAASSTAPETPQVMGPVENAIANLQKPSGVLQGLDFGDAFQEYQDPGAQPNTFAGMSTAQQQPQGGFTQLDSLMDSISSLTPAQKKLYKMQAQSGGKQYKQVVDTLLSQIDADEKINAKLSELQVRADQDAAKRAVVDETKQEMQKERLAHQAKMQEERLAQQNELQEARIRAQQNKSTPEEAVSKAEEVLGTIDLLKQHPGRKGAVGFKGTAQGFGVLPKPIPGTNESGFVALYDALKSQLTLDNMGKMKGVLSDSDMKVLSAAASSLTLDMPQKDFDREVERVRAKMQGVIDKKGINPNTKVLSGQSSGGGSPTPTVGQVVNGYRYKGGDPKDPNSWEAAQ